MNINICFSSKSMHIIIIIIIKISCGFNFVVLRLSVPLEHCLDQC